MARRLSVANVISLDMGGTTNKASVIEDYEIRRSSEFEVGGPISRGSRLNKGRGYLCAPRQSISPRSALAAAVY